MASTTDKAQDMVSNVEIDQVEVDEVEVNEEDLVFEDGRDDSGDDQALLVLWYEKALVEKAGEMVGVFQAYHAYCEFVLFRNGDDSRRPVGFNAFVESWGVEPGQAVAGLCIEGRWLKQV